MLMALQIALRIHRQGAICSAANELKGYVYESKR